MGHPGLFFHFFGLFQTLQILQQIYVQNIQPIHGPGNWTHDLQIMSLIP